MLSKPQYKPESAYGCENACDSQPLAASQVLVVVAQMKLNRAHAAVPGMLCA